MLTLVTLAQGPPQNLSYPSLLSSLDFTDVTVLQALLTQAIYAGLLAAKLNPRAQRVDLISITPSRDLAPGSVPDLIKILAAWEGQCVLVNQEIEERASKVHMQAEERQRIGDARNAELEEALSKIERPTKREGDMLSEFKTNDSKKGGHHGFLAGRAKDL